MVENILNANNQTSKIPDTSKNQLDKPAQQDNNEFNFDDILDVINPLHHIPIVSNIYHI